MPNISTPITVTLSESSKDDYARRYNQLVLAAKGRIADETGQPKTMVQITPADLVDFVLGKKGDYETNSWRLVRRSVAWSLEQMASSVATVAANMIMLQVERLRGERADPDDDRDAKTSSTKAKKLADGDLALIKQTALEQRSKYKHHLVLYLKVGTLTGLRPCEWPGAELRRSTRDGFAWMLVVANAKATNQRAHGSHRILYFAELDAQTADDILAWTRIARGSRYQRLLNTIGRLLWKVTRELWPDRTEWPTLYTTRHVAVAAWKAHFLRKEQTDAERLEALATIAALMGHASDATASRHYARANAGRKVIVPSADPEQVARVRQVVDLRWFEKLLAENDEASELDGHSLSATPSPCTFPP
jgi:integrase